MNLLVNFIIGMLFSIGLVLSSMINPKKVIGFLDIFGNWDPSLIFVMLGGICVNLIFFKIILKRSSPVLGAKFSLPEIKQVDKKLVIGSAIFGIGWGISGVCPGPAVANLFLFETGMIIFITSLIVGILIHHFLKQKNIL